MLLTLTLAACLARTDTPANFDAFLQNPRRLALGQGLTAQGQQKLAERWASQFEPRLGVPTILWLAAPPAGARTPRSMGLSAVEAARRVLFDNAELYRFTPAALAELPVSDVHDLGEGAVVVTFHRELQGVPVYREAMHVVMTPELVPVAITGALSSFPSGAAFRLTPETALAVAVQQLTGQFPDAKSVARLALAAGGWEYHATAGGRLDEPPRLRRTWYSTGSRLVAAYQLEVAAGGAGSSLVVSAEDGAVLTRLALDADAQQTYRVWAQAAAPFTPMDGPQGDDASPFPTGATTLQPAMVAPLLVTLDHATLATNDPWLPLGAATLAGNNADAYADLFPPDGLNDSDAGLPPLEDGGGDVRVAVPALASYDFGQQPDQSTAQPSASAAQAFFVVNWLHDTYYQQGFTEAAGNGQLSNLGRGGLENDALRVEVQDYNLRNNAGMRTPADGHRPRLQLGVFDGFGPSQLLVTSPPGRVATYGAGPLAAPRRSWDVGGEVLPVQDADGGLTGCSPWQNRAALSGKVALVSAFGCAYDEKFAHAMDAGVIGVLLGGAGDLASGLSSAAGPPAQFLPDAGLQSLLAAFAAQETVTVRLRRPEVLDRDVALESSVVAHEWAHFLANRLIGDSQGLLNTSARGLGEGWSDFAALLLMARETDGQLPANANWSGAWAIGQYTQGGQRFDGSDNQGAYYGLRRFPYSVDFGKNALTYKHVGTNVPLPTTAPSNPDLLFSGDNAEVHNAGEVWANALWGAFVGLVQDSPRLAFPQAHLRAEQYLVASLKATPSLPSFLEARDALLTVVRAADPQDFTVVLHALALRGFGLGATAPDRASSTNTPLGEDFTEAGGALKLVGMSLTDDRDSCDSDGVLDANEKGTLTIRLMNIGAQRLTQTTLVPHANNAALTLEVQGLSLPPSDPFTLLTAQVPVHLGDVTELQEVEVSARLSDPAVLGQPVTFRQSLRLNADVVRAPKEDFEVGEDGWVADASGSFPFEQGWLWVEGSPTSHWMQSRDPDSAGESTLTSPALHVGGDAFGFTFEHSYDFDADVLSGAYFDGGILELSTDGFTFTQVPGAAISPTYDGPLAGTGSNPLRGLTAFRGLQPTPLLVTVELGTQYANRTVWLRFRLGADAAGGKGGWAVDNLVFTGLVDQPFTEVIAHRRHCRNRPPSLSGTPSFTVDERTRVKLVPGAASDPDGDPLTCSWTQTLGPEVFLDVDEFTAPDVSQTTTLGFTVRVSDVRGGSASDTLSVTVRNVNRVPTAVVGKVLNVNQGATVTLDGRDSFDPDGDSLRYQWEQTAGPAVTFSDAAGAATTFTAPDATVTTRLTFSLVALDQESASEPASVTVTILPPVKCGCAQGESPVVGAFLLAVLLLWRRR